MGEHRLAGLQILVVEDETLVAVFLEDMLKELECEVVGPAPRLVDALEFLDKKEKEIDCAILDVNVAGELIYPLAEILTEREVPFLFVTGYSQASVAPEFRHRPMLQKPFLMTELRDLLVDMCPPRTKNRKRHTDA
jgi:two-component SAPR family response regulator